MNPYLIIAIGLGLIIISQQNNNQNPPNNGSGGNGGTKVLYPAVPSYPLNPVKTPVVVDPQRDVFNPGPPKMISGVNIVI